MMMFLNCASLLMIFLSLMVAVVHPRIKFPLHVDAIMLVVAVGSAAVFINTVLGWDMRGHLQNAEVLTRFGAACLIVRLVYGYLRVKSNEND